MNRLGILGVLVALPALAQINTGSVAHEEKSTIAPHQHAPMKLRRVRDDGTLESNNWSGYAVTGSAFTHVRGSWVVPTAYCGATPNAYSSFWVGLDGLTSGTVEQIGTDSDCNGTTPSYYAWYEFNPLPSTLIESIQVSPGNLMSASVSYSGGEFTLTITNESTGESYTETSRFSGAMRSSAEWIAEAPCCTRSGGILPLSDFGTVFFDAGLSTDSSTSGPISSFGRNVEEINMTSKKGAEEALALPLTAGGSSFSVTWRSE